jgi:hypothetical protein
MTSIARIVGQLKTEERRLTRELGVIRAALTAFKASPNRSKGRRQLSVAGRARISAAQKARWVKPRGGRPNVVAMPKSRTMSAAARKKIAAAQRARWAKVRAQSKAA